MSGDGGTRHLISLADLSDDDIDVLVRRTLLHASDHVRRRTLEHRVVGLYFALTSTRTRTAFTAGAHRLGADVISYGPGDLQLNTGESLGDTSRVLASMLDALVLRTHAGSAEARVFAAPGRMSVINGMSADEHPTQALADLATMHQLFGGIEGLRVLYLGEGNSTATALAEALSRRADTVLHLRTPPHYGLPAWSTAAVAGRPGKVVESSDADDLPSEVDVVYTTRWQTTGTAKRHENWRELFTPFRVDRRLMDRYPNAFFLHDLPAHRGDEVEAEVIDGPRSVVFRQAENKLYSAMAALEWCLTERS